MNPDPFKNLVRFYGTKADTALAKANQVRHLLGSSHWQSDGAYKESLVRDALRSAVPQSLSVRQGFIVIPEDEARVKPSKQCDALVLDQTLYAPIFEDGDFVIALAPFAVAAIEVKSTLRNSMEEAIQNIGSAYKLHQQAKGSTQPSLFTGVVGFSDFGCSGGTRGPLCLDEAKTICGYVAREYVKLFTPVPGTLTGLGSLPMHAFPSVICSLSNPAWVAYFDLPAASERGVVRRLPCLTFLNSSVVDKAQGTYNHSMQVLLGLVASSCVEYIVSTVGERNGSDEARAMATAVNWPTKYSALTKPISLIPPTDELRQAFRSVEFLADDEYEQR